MRSRQFAAVIVLLVLLFGGAGAVLAVGQAQRGKIAPGIRIGGIDVGGLTVTQASSRLHSAYAPLARRTIVLRYRGRTFVLSSRDARVRVVVAPAVEQAMSDSQQQDLVGRVARAVTGGGLRENLQPAVRFSEVAAGRLLSRVRAAVDRPARDATVGYSAGALQPVPSAGGRVVQLSELRARMMAALVQRSGGGPIDVPVSRTAPRITTAQLAARNPTIITVDRGSFTLRLWRYLRPVRTYRIAVGMAGLETPAGLYHVQEKEVNPSWHVPNSSWAGGLAGQTIPPGPQDPIKARWMGIYNGAGIHGTDELGSLGSAASHGCIRMAIPDVIELYDRTPLGTPVYIA